MVRRSWAFFAACLLAAMLGVSGLDAQTGTLAGRVVDAETGAVLTDAAVEVLSSGNQQAAGVFSNAQGQFRLELPAGSYSVVVALLGFDTRRFDGVSIDAGQTTTLDISLSSTAFVLNPIVVTASRRQEKALEAPARVEIVGQEAIRERAAPAPFEHVKATPGVDIAQSGLSQANVVARGFNNIFSGALLVITDNRYAAVPSLRVNAFNFIPINNLDLERIEVVLGPGAALYGPNSASGVLHMITASPIDHPGTAVELGGGARSVFQGMFRSAHRLSDNAGIKISGQYFRGDDWQHFDSVEVALRRAAIDGGADPSTLRIGNRSFDQERWGGEARLDFRPWDDGEVIFNAGINRAISSIELTGIGAGQADNWTYSYVQSRLTKGRFFGQVFLNSSDAGDTFLLRDGDQLVDKSKFFGAQLQHGISVGERQNFTYGLDLQWTRPDTEGTINGANEEDDGINEIGGYLHSETGLSDRVDLVAALRVDDHNFLEDVVFSPRAALVLRPDEDTNIRFTYNRAFSTPTSNNLFLDRPAGRIPIGPTGYDIRVRGVPKTGFTFDDRCTGGVSDYCMLSPFAPGMQLPATGVLLWDGLVPVVLAGLAAQNPALAPLVPTMEALLTAGDPAVASLLRRFDSETLTFGDEPGPSGITPIDPTIYNTFEVGYKGLIADRFLLAGDVYYQKIEDFVGPLRVETPSVFLDPATSGAFVQTALMPLLTGGTLDAATFAAVVQGITSGMASIPVGTVTPDGAASPDLILTYRNFGEVTLWGADFSGQFLLDDRWSLTGTYSLVSKDCFDADDNGTADCGDPRDIALNAPKNKGSLAIRFDDERAGFTGEASARFTAEFPMNSGVYIGEVEGYTVVDINAIYQLPFYPGASVGLSVNNLFGDEHREFIGAPELGRLVLGRLRVEF